MITPIRTRLFVHAYDKMAFSSASVPAQKIL